METLIRSESINFQMVAHWKNPQTGFEKNEYLLTDRSHFSHFLVRNPESYRYSLPRSTRYW